MLVLRQAVRVRLRVDHLGPLLTRGCLVPHVVLVPRLTRAHAHILLERVLAGEERARALRSAAQLLVAEGLARRPRPGGGPAVFGSGIKNLNYVT